MSAPILVGLVLAALAAGYVVAPLIWPAAFGVGATPAGAAAGSGAADSLEGLRDDLYARLVELDFEHATGKTDEEEYRQERAALKRRALAVLRTLDERAALAPIGDEPDAIEREVRAARDRRAAMRVAPDDDALAAAVEREVLALRRDRQAAGARGGDRG